MIGLLIILQSFSSPIFQQQNWAVYPDRVIQDQDTAVAVSPFRLESTAGSQFLVQNRQLLEFKFAINGYDNERGFAQNHRILLVDSTGEIITPIYTFGQAHPEDTVHSRATMVLPQTVTLQVDMNPVWDAINLSGSYTGANGQVFTRENFKGVWVAGSHDPLTWDFDNLASRQNLKMSDDDGDRIYELTVTIPDQISFSEKAKPGVWTPVTDISSFPQLKTDYPLFTTLYNMSLDEMVMDIRDDGAFMAGRLWTGVWTRDISYSILLSLAALHPEASKKSLIAKVKNGKIIQDTGTGGSWPVSSDRMTWALAAWEVYLWTGDREWLKSSYQILGASVFDDQQTLIDPHTGLYYGESSFLDWREQSYPKWMDPKDIYKSQTLGTNVVHFRTLEILRLMAVELNNLVDQSFIKWHFDDSDQQLKANINKHLWNTDKGWYNQFVYGRQHFSVSEKPETLGEALAILTGVADQKQATQILNNLPIGQYGTACFYPQIPGIPPYHNNGIWPFVQAYHTWAGAKMKHVKTVEFGVGAMMRAAALFTSNMENMVAETGSFKGTELNSERQLWSVAGQLAMTYRVFLGMEATPDGLFLNPVIPKNWKGTISVTGLQYREAILNVTVKGYGTGIQSVKINGQQADQAFIAADVQGGVELVIELDGHITESKLNPQPHHVHLPTPMVTIKDDLISWTPIENAFAYTVVVNGKEKASTQNPFYKHKLKPGDEVQVAATDDNGWSSFLSEPVNIPQESEWVECESGYAAKTDADGYTGEGYLVINHDLNTTLKWMVNVKESGTYSLDFRYANGHGPINTDNKCAIRTLRVNGHQQVVVFPQRGAGEWSNWWGYSNSIELDLPKGDHTVTLTFEPFNNNMNGQTNEAFIDHIRMRRLGE